MRPGVVNYTIRRDELGEAVSRDVPAPGDVFSIVSCNALRLQMYLQALRARCEVITWMVKYRHSREVLGGKASEADDLIHVVR